MSESNEKERRSRLIASNNEIARHASKKELAQAVAIFESMKAEDLANSHTYAATLNAYIRCGDVLGARLLFDEIKNSHRFKLDVISFTTMMKGYCAEGDIESATLLLNSMPTSKPPVSPNIRTMNTYFRGCIITGSVAKAIAAFDNMKQVFKVSPDVSTYESVINLCCQGLLLELVLPMIGRIKGEESMRSGLSAMYYAVGRAAAVVGDYKLMKKSLASALDNLPFINDEDNDGEETAVSGKAAVSGGKRSWHSQMDGSRQDSLALFRSHKQEELAREISIVSKYGEVAQSGAMPQSASPVSYFLKVLSFPGDQDSVANLVEQAAALSAGNSAMPEFFNHGAQQVVRPAQSPLPALDIHQNISEIAPDLDRRLGLAHNLLGAMIEKLGLGIVVQRACSTAQSTKMKQLSLSAVTHYHPVGEVSGEKPKKKPKSVKHSSKKSGPTPSAELKPAREITVPESVAPKLAVISSHIKDYFSDTGFVRFDKLFSELEDSATPNEPAAAGSDAGGDADNDRAAVASASPSGSRSRRPIHIEVCSGAGEWVVAQAEANTEADWVASELRHDRVYQTISRAICSQVSNLAVLGGDIMKISPSRIASNSVHLVCVNHPEPPQQSGESLHSQAKHLLDETFLVEMGRILELHGMLTIVTDNSWYSKFLARSIGGSSNFTSSHNFRAKTGGVLCALTQSIASQCGIKSADSWGVSCEEGGVEVFEGAPGPECGYFVEASSYFDRMWKRSNLTTRYFLVLRKVRENENHTIHPSYLSKLASKPASSSFGSTTQPTSSRPSNKHTFQRALPAVVAHHHKPAAQSFAPAPQNKKLKFED